MPFDVEATRQNLDTEELRDSNKKALLSMWSDLTSRVVVTPEPTLYDVSSFSAPKTLFTSDGKEYPAKLILGGYLGISAPVESSSIYVHILNAQHEVIGSRQYFIHFSDASTLEVDSDMKVEDGYDHSGLGSALIELDEMVQLLVARIFIKDISRNITHIKSSVTDATTDQNPHWTTRRYEGQPGWVKVSEKTWERTIDVDPNSL